MLQVFGRKMGEKKQQQNTTENHLKIKNMMDKNQKFSKKTKIVI